MSALRGREARRIIINYKFIVFLTERQRELVIIKLNIVVLPMANVTEMFFLLICALFTLLKTGKKRALFLFCFRYLLLFEFLFYFVLFLVDSIHCYQCSGTDSDNSFECNEFLASDVTLQAIDCGTLHDAQYCIKHVGRNEGGTPVSPGQLVT